MQKLSTTIFLMCMPFIIFPKGCDGQICSDASLNNCGEIYHTRRVAFGARTQACSGTTSQIACIHEVIAHCILKPNDPESRRVKNLGLFKLNTFKQMGCVAYKVPVNGDGRVKTSLLTLAVACLFVFILY